MPYGRKYASRRKPAFRRRRPFTRRVYRRRRRTTAMVNRSAYPVSSHLRTKLKYTAVLNLGTSGVTPVEYFFRGNSLYDPDFTGTGHQPLGFDQIMNLYSKFFVSGSSIRLTASGNTTPVMIVLAPEEDTTGVSILPTAAEKPKAKSRLLASTGTSQGIMRSYATTYQMTGKSKNNRYDDDLSGSASANPTLQWYWYIGYQHPDLTNSAGAVFQVDIVYYVTFYDRIRLNAS